MRRQTLRVVHERTRSEGERVAIALSAPARPVRRASVPFSWTLAAADAADIRWYLEDYLDAPYDPAPQIAARVEGRMREIGADLFSAVFDAHAEARALWRAVASQLNATRVVVTSAPDVAVGIPGELIADPASGQTLATDARAFVRAVRAPRKPAGTRAPGP